jgi:hypothetical protein
MAAKAQFKEGQTVRWTSQANGYEVEKQGVIVAVCRNEWIELSQKSMINILRETDPDMTVSKARDMARCNSHFHLLKNKYRLRFDPTWRDGIHYLVEVDQGEGRKPHLYHPRVEALEAV